MKEQIDIFGNVGEIKKPVIDKVKRNWENRFQRWSTTCMIYDNLNHYGKCGYGSMCDYCEDNTYGRPCVRALNEMLREKNIVLDYEKITFEEVWDGNFEQRKTD